MTRRVKPARIACALVSAVVLTLLTVSFERAGPELVQYGDAIYEPVSRGGFPLAYLFDVPGISVQRQLGPEDELFVGALIADIAFYFVIVLLGVTLVGDHRAHRTRGTNRTR